MEPPKGTTPVPKKARMRVKRDKPNIEEIPGASSSELRFS